MDAINAFKATMLEHDTPPPDTIIADGEKHRFMINGKLNGFYKLHMGGRSAGCFQNWKIHDKPIYWKQDGYTQRLSDDKRQQYAAQRRADDARRQAEQAAKHAQAQRNARYIWQNAKPIAEHPYLTRKKIKQHGTRVDRHGALVLPLLNANLELVNLQLIYPEGSKRFLSGGKKAGCFWWIGKLTDTILIAEGFATAASIYEDTGQLTIIAFDAGNLDAVAKVVRQRNPKAKIIIMADNDLSGVGQAKARAAALAVGGKYLVCPISGQDFNDYLTSGDA